MAEGRGADATERLRASAVADDVSFLLARANALSLAAGNAALAPFGLKVRSYSVLALCVADAGPSQRELSEFLRLDPSQVVALVDDLQSRRLVERRPDATDRRANVVVATASGRDVFARAQRAALTAEQELHAALSEDDRMRLADVLRRIAFPA